MGAERGRATQKERRESKEIRVRLCVLGREAGTRARAGGWVAVGQWSESVCVRARK